jgi:2-polyprenyl-3-methyl-5-hydroxy-6-metoxy-1,4-benzoquinol methylase
MPTVLFGGSGVMVVTHAETVGRHFDADENRWEAAKQIIGTQRVTLGPSASQQWLDAPEHLGMVIARYRAAAELIGDAESVIEIGCGEGIGAGILGHGRESYIGIDTDAEAIQDAISLHVSGFGAGTVTMFSTRDVLDSTRLPLVDAVVALDVIEHIPSELTEVFLGAAVEALRKYGVLVIGTPSKSFDHLASPQSATGHINTFTHDRLKALMARHFHTVQMFGMQDTALHFGHPDARHYHLAVGIGPR